jgi:putative PIG3 family NAD(P)H quinone oxidoreductase
LGSYTKPIAAPEQVLIKVHAFGLNRADLLQRKGMYPPPAGDSEILGLEVSGEIVSVGNHVTSFSIGDRVCALVGGGGYATHCIAHRDMVIKLPDNMAYSVGAAIPEAYLTAWQAISWHAHLKPAEKILIHAGASGVGLAAIQISSMLKAKVAATASSGKHTLCHNTGAELCIDYKSQSFDTVISEQWDEVDVIIDFIGGPYLSQNFNCIALDGRIVVLGLMGGWQSEMNMAQLLRKRIRLIGSTLRSRAPEYKAELTKDFIQTVFPFIADGSIKPVIDSVLPWTAIKEAHDRMEQNLNAGKIIMTVTH